jgi:hypothetical protein
MMVRYAAILKRIRAVQSASKIGGKGERYMLPGLAEKLWVYELIVQNVHDLQVCCVVSRRAALLLLLPRSFAHDSVCFSFRARALTTPAAPASPLFAASSCRRSN